MTCDHLPTKEVSFKKILRGNRGEKDREAYGTCSVIQPGLEAPPVLSGSLRAVSRRQLTRHLLSSVSPGQSRSQAQSRSPAPNRFAEEALIRSLHVKVHLHHHPVRIYSHRGHTPGSVSEETFRRF